MRIAAIAERLERNSIPEPNSGCHIWTGGLLCDDAPYGRMYFEGETDLAHRWAFRIWRGPIPKGIFVCHHCDLPPCINPDHLFLGTSIENNEDMFRKGRNRLPPNRSMTSRLHRRDPLPLDVRLVIKASKKTAKELAEELGLPVREVAVLKKLFHATRIIADARYSDPR